MLFTYDELDRVLNLHEKSYVLFRWLREVVNSGAVAFDVVHKSTSSTESAVEWLQRCRGSFPSSISDGLTDMTAFANLVISYLSTSFELKEKAKAVNVARQCCCGWCVLATRLNHLVPRQPNRKDFQTAEELKRLHLTQLAADCHCDLSVSTKELFERNESLSFELAHLAYVRELFRRTEFASQGTSVLALWRTIAWKNNNPIPNFRLLPARILDAQRIVESVVRQTVVA